MDELWQQVLAGSLIAVVSAAVGFFAALARIGSRVDRLFDRFDSLDRDVSEMVGVVKTVTKLEQRVEDIINYWRERSPRAT